MRPNKGGGGGGRREEEEGAIHLLPETHLSTHLGSNQDHLGLDSLPLEPLFSTVGS
ncbi:hypothetical protein ACSBR2_017650 [Camellia fascicularis]